jgi:hypothetical protein
MPVLQTDSILLFWERIKQPSGYAWLRCTSGFYYLKKNYPNCSVVLLFFYLVAGMAELADARDLKDSN